MSFDSYIRALPAMQTVQWAGHVRELVGLLVASEGPAAAVGDFCEIQSGAGRIVRAQVVGFRDGCVLLMPLEETGGLQHGDRVVARPEAARVEAGPGLLGRVLDGFGRPIDGGPAIDPECLQDLYAAPPGPLEREHITAPMITGVRAIDGLLSIGEGQRMGIFGGSGVGKSTLLGAMSRHNSADVTVIGLIGERNREVREFIEHELGPQGLKRSVVVVATSDVPAPLRIRAAFVAVAVAEYFRDAGKRVLLVLDSVTRLAMAQREIGLAAGEPPSQKGYTPSVFSLLPKLFERAGNFKKGPITGFFTVLVDGDDFNEPICDTTRSILDGHIILSRELGAMGHYPAIDVLNSISRLANRISTQEQREAARSVRAALAEYRRSEDLINLGAYTSGSNPALDAAIRLRPAMLEFLRQDSNVMVPVGQTLAQLNALAQHAQ